VSTDAVTGGHDEAAPASAPPQPRLRRWLAAVGGALVLACLVPPLATLAHRYVFAESIQFVVLAMAGPALIVLGAPWRFLRLYGPAQRLAAARRDRTSFLHGAVFLLAFIGVCLAWRLPPVIDALARYPALLAAEAVTLLAVGTALWLELVSSPPLHPRLPSHQRAVVAALAMWSTWIVAYVLGLSNGAVFRAYDATGSGLSAVADQQLSAGLAWAVSAFCFVPVIFVTALNWLREQDDPDEQLQQLTRAESRRAVVKGWERPRRRRAPSG
jgi:cytochrome c oxidase assembly factor CtaG